MTTVWTEFHDYVDSFVTPKWFRSVDLTGISPVINYSSPRPKTPVEPSSLFHVKHSDLLGDHKKFFTPP
ncbi:hypothetical protein FD37_GL001771 [Levilactobacillus spicheri DSM 15429]|uniref:Uncharacterized protein n=1 Tax=Levilactobacillus spicheri DSM 15429 TaxID=1423805 RepID=A0A0R1RBQ6_9LACO|nr:hypothetical protein FD37_GL001771 [Levilactobacillus spicheri DSM 15429]